MNPTRPIIMTAGLAPPDFAWADAQRRKYFPPERNIIAAHLTLFHHLPPGYFAEIKHTLTETTTHNPPPTAQIDRLLHLGRGAAYHVYSPELQAMRSALMERFSGLLTAQDKQLARLHITIQNKVSPSASKALFEELSVDFVPRTLHITALELHEYCDGPWLALGRWPFRGARLP
jgi:hypothetical protein